MASWGSGAGEGVSANPSIYPAHRSFMCKTHFRVVPPFGTLLIEIIQPKKNKTRKKIKSVPLLLHREALPHPEHTQQMPSSFYTNTYLYSSIVPCPKKSTSLEGQNHVPIHFYLIYGVKLIKRLLSSLWLCLHMQFNIYGINELFDIMELIWRVW